MTIELFSQSETLWFLAPLDELIDPFSDQIPPGFLLASDRHTLPPWRPERGKGHFIGTYGHPVIIPSAHVLMEAFLRIYARDVGKRIGSFAISMVLYIEMYVDEDGLLDVSKLPPVLRDAYLDLKGGKQLRHWTKELQKALNVPLSLSDSEED